MLSADKFVLYRFESKGQVVTISVFYGVYSRQPSVNIVTSFKGVPISQFASEQSCLNIDNRQQKSVSEL